LEKSSRPWKGRGRVDAMRAKGSGAAKVGDIDDGKRRR